MGERKENRDNGSLQGGGVEFYGSVEGGKEKGNETRTLEREGALENVCVCVCRMKEVLQQDSHWEELTTCHLDFPLTTSVSFSLSVENRSQIPPGAGYGRTVGPMFQVRDSDLELWN